MMKSPAIQYHWDYTIESMNIYESMNRLLDVDIDEISIATWNISNLGKHDRTNDDIKIISDILSYFDIVAIQEIANNLEGLNSIMEKMQPMGFEFIFSDKSGNSERLGYVYNTNRIKILNKVGEVVINKRDRKWVKLDGVDQEFDGFDRNPYVCTFLFNGKKIMLVSCHSIYGSTSEYDINRRALEAYAVGRYADLRRRSKYAYTKNIVVLGDLNLDLKYDGIIETALKERGLVLPIESDRLHKTNTGGNQIYDQVAFFPSMKSKVTQYEVLKIDEVLFQDLKKHSIKDFGKFIRYHISDHRPLWIKLKI